MQCVCLQHPTTYVCGECVVSYAFVPVSFPRHHTRAQNIFTQQKYSAPLVHHIMVFIGSFRSLFTSTGVFACQNKIIKQHLHFFFLLSSGVPGVLSCHQVPTAAGDRACSCACVRPWFLSTRVCVLGCVSCVLASPTNNNKEYWAVCLVCGITNKQQQRSCLLHSHMYASYGCGLQCCPATLLGVVLLCGVGV